MRFACNTCPYVHNITRKVGCVKIKNHGTRYVVSKSYFKSVLLSTIQIQKMLVSRAGLFFSFLQVNNRKYPKLKEVDDVLGGAAAWENVDSTAGK